MERTEREEAVRVLKRGGLVAFPTDTVYGLGCDPFDEAAVRRIYQVKGRPLTQGLPLLLRGMDQVSLVAEEVSSQALALMGRFWPGGLTIVLKKSPRVPDIVTAGPTVAVRVPGHPIPLALIAGLGAPIVGTSANRSGSPSPTTSEEVAAQLQGVGLILCGECYHGVESTIVDCTGPAPRVLRWGAISRRELEEALGQPIAG